MTEDLSHTAEGCLQAGATHYAAGRLVEAEAAMREAVRLDPSNMGALANLGAVLRARRRPDEALDVYEAALAIEPDSAAVLINRANLLNDLRRWPQALESATQALATAPDNPAAHNARGNAQAGLGNRAEALASYRQALRAEPDSVSSLFNIAVSLRELGDVRAALETYTRILAIDPGFAMGHAGQGNAFAQLTRWTEAAAAYERAYALDPDQPYAAGQRLHARMKICDWRDFDGVVADLAERISAGKPAATPFSIAAAPLSARQQLACARTYAAKRFAVSARPAGAAPGERIRVGYFSADFHDHATAYLMAEMLELHDREAFEITAFSYGRSSQTPIRARLQAACERFFDVRALGAGTIRDMARQLSLDIAVDLKGFTTNSRPEIFAAGVAPLQVSFLGYPMTTGAPFIDYLIADRVLIEAGDRDLYSEKVAWLPGCYQPNDRKRAIAERATTRADHGLPPDAFVFASFNGSYKITPAVFEVWAELLRALPDAVLWLIRDDATATRNLRQAAAAAGIDPGRLVFAPFRPLAEHLERLGHADLFLGSFPYTAHTTASDALWAGLPLLTRKGETFASRVAASLLTAVGLPEMAVETVADYKAAALALARAPERLQAIRAKLAAAWTTSVLFDTPAYVRGLEDAYRRMHERRLAGLPPAHLP
ncbi:tetratricopeptide repeat protein [Phenylobacterium sp.]|uniref:O-linked N-acetylglucosamine transferase, SPINDLY family protein n=1 Tax=Phenylobacterium sp. TaxID=1871053 RepID=UPI003568D480